MLHSVKLSNGEILLIEEGDDCLTLSGQEGGGVGLYICQLQGLGVTTYPNSGSALGYLTRGLKRGGASPDIQRVALQWVPSPTYTIIAAGPIIHEDGCRPWRRVLTRFDATQLSVHTEIFRVDGRSCEDLAERCARSDSFLESGYFYSLSEFDEAFSRFHQLLGKQVKT